MRILGKVCTKSLSNVSNQHQCRTLPSQRDSFCDEHTPPS
jgi:hypothetical protein